MSRGGYTDNFVKHSRVPSNSKKKFNSKERSYGYEHDPTTGQESTYKRRSKYTPQYELEEDYDEYDDNL